MPNRCRSLGTLGGDVLKVRPPDMQSNLGKHEVELLCEGGTLISFIWPAQIQICLIGWQGQNYGVGNGCRASAEHKDGCPEFNGKHRWLPR